MPQFLSTDLPKLKDEEDDRSIKKSILDLLDKINSVADAQYPVGYVYTQYPGTSDPATLFGGTWLNITSLYSGLFFRAEGGSSLAFNAGNQLDAFQGHHHSAGNNAVGSRTTYTPLAGGASFGGGNLAEPGPIRDPIADESGNGTPRTASETRPVNTTIRIWQRSGGTLTTTTGTSVTSGIYDSGTNSNGSWIRFTDGTMMCWDYQSVTDQAINNVYGTLFQETRTISLPQTFTAIPAVTFMSKWGTSASWSSISLIGTSTFSARFIDAFTRATGTTVIYAWTAMGKWK